MQDLDTSRPGGRASGERDFAPFRPQGLPGDLSGHRVRSPWHRTGGGAVSPRPPSGTGRGTPPVGVAAVGSPCDLPGAREVAGEDAILRVGGVLDGAAGALDD